MENINNILNIAFVGNVDNGKSTIAGNLLYQLGIVDDNQLSELKESAIKNKKESWYYAYILDTIEEQKNGKTQDYIIVSFECYINEQKYTINLIDNPGHLIYVNNSISGITLSDIVIVIISMKNNEFNTCIKSDSMLIQHILISKSFGIKKYIFVLNKMDCIDWDVNIYNERKKILIKLFEIYNINIVDFIPVSGFNGENLTKTINKKEFENVNNLLDSLKNNIIKYNINYTIAQTFDTFVDDKTKQNFIGIKIYNYIDGIDIYNTRNGKKIELKNIESFNGDKNIEIKSNVIGKIINNDKLFSKGDILTSNIDVISKSNNITLDIIFFPNNCSIVITRGLLFDLYIGNCVYKSKIVNFENNILYLSKKIQKIKTTILIIDNYIFYNNTNDIDNLSCVMFRKNDNIIGIGRITE